MSYIKIREIVLKNRYINTSVNRARKELIRAIFVVLITTSVILVIVISVL